LPIGTTVVDGRAQFLFGATDRSVAPPAGPRSRAIAKRLGMIRLGDRSEYGRTAAGYVRKSEHRTSVDDAWNADRGSEGAMVLARSLRKGESAGCSQPPTRYNRPAEVWILTPDDRAIIVGRFALIGQARFVARALASYYRLNYNPDAAVAWVAQSRKDGLAQFRTQWEARKSAHVPRPIDPALRPCVDTGIGIVRDTIGNIVAIDAEEWSRIAPVGARAE